MSTRAGRVRSSSSSRQARPRRVEAGDTSEGAGLNAGTGTRARRGASCAASSSPRSFSIAPRRLPPRSPQGRGRALSGLPQESPSSPHRVAMGTMGDQEPQGTWSPGAGRRVPKGAQVAGLRLTSAESGRGGRVRCQWLQGAECGGAQSAQTAPAAAALIGRDGAGPGTRAAFSRAPPAPVGVLRCALGVAAASSSPFYGSPPHRAPTCSGHPRRGSSLPAAPCPYRRHATPPGPSALHSATRTTAFDGKTHPVCGGWEMWRGCGHFPSSKHRRCTFFWSSHSCPPG